MQKEIENLYIYNIANYIGSLLKNGIEIDDKTISFTMLDYFCITDMNIYTMVGKLRKMDAKKIKYQYHSYLSYFAEKEGLLVREVDGIEEILNEHHAFIINNERFEPTSDDINYIFDLFEKNRIPKYSKLIYIALHRMALNMPILPLYEGYEEIKTR